MARIETRIHTHQADEAANEQTGPRKQYKRQAHLQYNERAAGHPMVFTYRAAASFFERFRNVRMRGDIRRQEAEENPGKKNGTCGKNENTRVHRDRTHVEEILGTRCQ